LADLLDSFDRAARWIDAYYRDPGAYPVLSRSQPGDLVRALPTHAPEEGESFDTIFNDFESLVIPGITHWNHPRFFAYFSISATPIAVIAEALAATLDVNAMLWRTSPAATELEDVVVGWLRELLGLDAGLHGIIYDTASTSGFTALAAARESLGLDIRERGLAGRDDLPALRVYITDHTHSHIEKAAIALGVGRANVVRVPVDAAYAMRPDALEAALRADISHGMRPMCVAATVGTTSTTTSDPVPEIAAICKRYATSMPRMPGRQRSYRSSRISSTAANTPIVSSSTRTSGCSYRSISPCSTSGICRSCGARLVWSPTIS
jgi:aromatic-L-amino-acid decarboxylase